jgi:hypothetical protein
VLLAAGISFALSLIGPSFSKAANFFLLPTRAWELLLGTILSIELLPVISTRLWRNVATGTGLLAIMVPAFFYSYTTPFPGFAALPPCIGAALVIAGGNAGTSVGGRLLSLRPVVWVGLISYSLYLWHWPIMVFRNLDTLLMAGSPPVTDKYAEFAAAVIIATLSWKFVESPFRKGPLRMSGANLFKVASASVVVTASIAGAFLFLGGLPFRFSPEVIRAASYLGNVPVREYRGGTCLTSPNRLNDFNKAVCLKVDEAKKNYLLLGDSYAAHLWYGLSNVMVDRNVMQATQAQCNAMIEPAADASESCRGLIDFIYGDYLTTHRIDALLLAQRWAEGDLPRLSKTIAWAKQRGIEVILFGPMLEYDMPLPVLHAYQIKNGLAQENGRHRNPRPKRIEERMTELNEKEWKIHYVSFFKALCEKATCIETASDGAQLQFDAGHLTKEGSLLVAQRIRADGDLP